MFYRRISIVKIFCPACGRPFETDGSKSVIYCSECGTEIPVPVSPPPTRQDFTPAEQPAAVKKKFNPIYAVLIVLAVLLGIGVYYLFLSPVYITDISMTKSEKTVLLGDEYTVNYTVIPSDYRYDSLTWTTDNEKVATVDNGVVRAVGGGSCIITACSKNGVKKSIKISVEILPEKLTLSQSSVEITVGSTATVSTSFEPKDVTDKRCEWESDNEDVATVKDGIITAVSEGSCVITVKSRKGDCSAKCKVKVIKPSPEKAITGTWNAYMCYNPETDRWINQSDNVLMINEDGTATEYVRDKTYNFTWKYTSEEEGNFKYTFTFDDGSSLDGCFFTQGDAQGTLALCTSQGLIIAFESATVKM